MDLTLTFDNLKTIMMSIIGLALLFLTLVFLIQASRNNPSKVARGIAGMILALIPLAIGLGIGIATFAPDLFKSITGLG